MGRPTDNPKAHKVTVKLDQESKDILDAYSLQETVSNSEAVRRGIKKLKDDLKKWKKAANSTKESRRFPQSNCRYDSYSVNHTIHCA